MLRGNNLFNAVLAGVSIAPQSISNTTVNGTAIVEPWRSYRQVVFILMGGSFAASSDGSFTFEGRVRGTTATYETLKDHASTPANLILQGAKYDDAGALEGGVLLATIDFSRIDTEAYDAIRVKFTSGAAAAQLISVAHLLYDPYNRPSGQSDEVFSLMINH